MSKDFRVDKNPNNQQVSNNNGERKVIDEANYRIHAPKENGPTAIGRGGDPLFRRINATPEQIQELMDETATVQNFCEREKSNNVAISCLNNENLKEIYYEIKDGFGEYGRISLMGFKTPQGVEIPRLKIYDTDGEVIEVLTGPMVIDEINKRALAYKESANKYEEIPDLAETDEIIADYSENQIG